MLTLWLAYMMTLINAECMNFEIQMHGFTCGVDDLMMMRSSEEKRKIELQRCQEKGEKGHFAFLGAKDGEIGTLLIKIFIIP